MTSITHIEIFALIGIVATFFTGCFILVRLTFALTLVWEMAHEYKRMKITEDPNLTDAQRRTVMQYLELEMPKRFEIDKHGFANLHFKNLPTVLIDSKGRKITI